MFAIAQPSFTPQHRRRSLYHLTFPVDSTTALWLDFSHRAPKSCSEACAGSSTRRVSMRSSSASYVLLKVSCTTNWSSSSSTLTGMAHAQQPFSLKAVLASRSWWSFLNRPAVCEYPSSHGGKVEGDTTGDADSAGIWHRMCGDEKRRCGDRCQIM